VDAIRSGCDVILYPGDLARTVQALERAAVRSEEFAGRVERAIARSERSLARFGFPPTAASGVRHAIDHTTRTLDLAADVIAGTPGVAAGWRAEVETEVVALADDPEIGPPAGREGPLGSILATTLGDAGWAVRRRVVERVDPSSARSAEQPARAVQRVVVLAATPRGWKGHGGPSPAVVARVRAELTAADRGLLVLLGHIRWLDDLAVPGVCAWSTETVMERAAAVWLDRRVRGGATS